MLKELKVNETPVRTSRNFNINNAKLKGINIPETIGNFENVNIIGKVAYNVSNSNITYGLGNELIKQVQENANQNLKVVVEENINQNVEIDLSFDKQNLNLVDNIEIIANENTNSTIVIKYESEKEIQAYHNGIIRILAKKNSKLNIVVINLMNTVSNNFISFENLFEENAKVNYTIVDFGGKNSITNYYSNLVGDNSENIINGIYLGKEDQFFDLNYIAELRGKKSNIDIEIQGALKDTAKKHFKGTIDFKKGCKKATGNENEFCTLLSDKAKTIALPMLLWSEEEVEGNPSSAAGKVGEKELFYIMSRGFNIKEAMKLIVRAKFNKILENIENEDLKEEILNEIDTRLD